MKKESRRDDKIIEMMETNNISPSIKPRRGGIYITPTGLGNGLSTQCYNPSTPSGLLKYNKPNIYNPNTPSGLVKCNKLSFYNPNTPSGLNL